MSDERIEPMGGAEVLYLKIAELQVHPRVQRKFKEARARKLLNEFDPARLTPLMVVWENGQWWVYEGQHRLWAITHWLNGDLNGQVIACYAKKKVTDKELAKDRLATDSQMKMTPIDRFLMAVLAEEPETLAIKQVLAKYDLSVAQTAGVGIVQCVGSCYRIVRRPGGVKMLDRVIGLLHKAYGKSQHAYHRDLVSALSLLVYKFGARLDDSGLVKAMTAGQKDAPGLVAAGETVAHGLDDCGTITGVMVVLLRAYNKGRKQKLSLDGAE